MNNEYLLEFEKKKDNLIPILQHLQERDGYLMKEEIEQVSNYLSIPMSKIYGVASFYAQFRFNKLGKYVIYICHGTSCHVNGSVPLSQAITEELNINEGETSPDGLVSLERVACLGCCSLSPVVMINDHVYGKVTIKELRKICKKIKRGNL
ncbi:MAG: NADH-quinone oxidoreductase subunit NuoE [Promethearchaeota archaeon]